MLTFPHLEYFKVKYAYIITSSTLGKVYDINIKTDLVLAILSTTLTESIIIIPNSRVKDVSFYKLRDKRVTQTLKVPPLRIL